MAEYNHEEFNDQFRQQFEQHCKETKLDLSNLSTEQIEAHMWDYVKKIYGSRAHLRFDENGVKAIIMPPLV